ncbi:MAG: lipid-A-disaccharide synthase [Acidobacteriota bacterium]
MARPHVIIRDARQSELSDRRGALPSAVDSSSRVLPQSPVSTPILLSCGEASGDLYAGELVRELRRIDSGVQCFGLGGRQLAEAGAELVAHIEEVSVIGLVEVLGKLPALRRARDRLLEAASSRRPDVAVLIDFSGFNLRLARKLKALGIPVVYYVSPQVWAWRRRRIGTIRANVDKMLVILPFEEGFYRSEDIPVTFVGHPLVDLVHSRGDRTSFCQRLELEAHRPLVAILPGSRRREIELHLPILVGAVERMARERPDLQFVLLQAPTVDRSDLVAGLGASAARIRIAAGSTHEGLAHAAAAIVASGTATVEAALCGTPMVVVYRVGGLSYRLGRPFVHVAHYAMVNLIAEKRLVPELIQENMTEEAVASECLRLVGEPRAAETMRHGLEEIRARLGGGGASRRAALEILSVARTCEAAHQREAEPLEQTLHQRKGGR